jgi:hypothetical protein
MSRHTFIQTPTNKRAELIARNSVFKAFGRVPMAPAKQVDLALAARLAFESVQRGTFSVNDRDTLACVVNVGMVLADKHCSAYDLTTATDAQEAMLRADRRVLEGKASWNFDGLGRQQMLNALDLHEQQIAALGYAAITDALLTMREMRARGEVHLVKLIGGAM